MDERQFRVSLADENYDCREFEMEANTFNPDHTHPWDARLFILEGQLILGTPDGEHQYGAGESCALAAGTVHSERVGPDGVKGVLGTKSQ